MRIAVIGDDGVGKSTLITCLFKDRFVPNIEDLLPPLTFPRTNGELVQVVDTSPSLARRPKLLAELRHANCIWLVYSDHYTMERISLFWLPFLRNSGVNLPVILCQNKQDHLFEEPHESGSVDEEEEVIQLMQDFKEIESFVRCSARLKRNVNEAFYLCQRAIAYPLAPLFDSKRGELKPLTADALKRIFVLCDEDQSGNLTVDKVQALQTQVFASRLDEDELALIRETLLNLQHGSDNVLYDDGITVAGFLTFAQLYCERGRHETLWAILRHFHYTDSLSLDSNFLAPKVAVGPLSHVELSPDGYQFLVDLFSLFDKDNDGGLSPAELKELFTPTPGLPPLWQENNFPYSTLRNDGGYVTLQGWLAQWSMHVFLDYHSALGYLAMLGYGSRPGTPRDIRTALKVTKPGKRRNRKSKVYRESTVQDRQVFHCYLIGRHGGGKSTLLSSFLGRVGGANNSSTVVNSVEMPGGKQCYLIIQELNSFEDAQTKLEQCDVVCLVYDSSDPDSFGHLVELRQHNRALDDVPLVFAALKADQDRVQQRCSEQPDEYTAALNIAAPMHVSSHWPSSLNALFVQLVDVAMNPGKATISLPGETIEQSVVPELAIAGTVAAAIGVAFWVYSRVRE